MIATLFALFAATAVAAPVDVDLTPVANYVSQFVKEIKSPVVVWHWFGGEGRNPIWKSAISSDSVAAYEHFVYATRNYYLGLCSGIVDQDPAECQGDLSALKFSKTSLYGPGFYAAVDPVITAFRGGIPNWVLLQIRLPQGFRYVDQQNVSSSVPSVPPEVTTALEAYGCAFSQWPADFIFNFLKQTYFQNLNPLCRVAVRKVLQNILKVDGFYYSYDGAYLSVCNLSSHKGAFVITDSKRFTPEDVRSFNTGTTDDREDRLRIISFFYKSAHDGNPGYAYPRPVVKNDPTIRQSPTWDDLEGAGTDPDIDQWIKPNLFQCSENPGS